MRSFLLFFSVGLLLGCSDAGRLPTYRVTGIVKFPDGSPLAGGWIVCHATEQGLAARAVIEPDGTFSLGTYESQDGAVAGQQLVAIMAAAPAGVDPDQRATRSAIARRLAHMDTSGLQFEVQANTENHVEFTVEPPRK